MEAKEARRRDRFQLLSVPAVQQAMAQSGLVITPEKAARVGVMISSAVGGISAIQWAADTISENGPRRISPFLIPMMMANGAAGMAAMDYGAMGPTFSVASACASSNDAIGILASAGRGHRCRIVGCGGDPDPMGTAPPDSFLTERGSPPDAGALRQEPTAW
jgi:3-oxoacyl-[acyl-carrier-protein] synthase II